MSRRSKVTLEIYQLADIYPDDLGYRVRCKLCGFSMRWHNKETGLDEIADHLERDHHAKGGKEGRRAASSTAT